MGDVAKLRELLERCKGSRMSTLRLIDDLAQTHRIAAKLSLPTHRVSMRAQWAKRNGLAVYEGSRWSLTPLGRALISQAEGEASNA